MQYMKQYKVRGAEKLLSHITLSSVQSSDVLLMPVHIESHWALLVCHLRLGLWEFYDSLSSSRHRVNLVSSVR